MSAVRSRIPRSAGLAAGVAAGAAAFAVGISPWATVGVGAAMAAAAAAAVGLGARDRLDVLLAIALGTALAGMRVLVGPAPGTPPPLPSDARGTWAAVVESVGSPRNGDQVARLRLAVDDGTVVVAATLPAWPTVSAGAEIEVAGRLRPPPEDDPYGEYLRRSGASGSLDATSLRVVHPAPAGSLQAWRDAAGDALRRALPEPEAGLAAGILIGLRERVDRGLAQDFATAGASHVVAISGWNIAIVAGIVGAALRGRSRRLVAAVVGATIAAYVVAAGASPSVVRAAVMASVVLVARESGRAGRAPAALAWAVTILLLASPEMIGDAGFRLSVLATAGLLAWATPLGARIGRLGRGRVPGWLAESLGISLAAQAATLPDVLATFGRLSLVAPAVNLLVVPLVPVAMAGGVLALGGGALAMAGAPPWVATLSGLPGWLLLHVMVTVVRAAAGLPFAALVIPPMLAAPTGAAAAAGIAAALAWRGWRQGRPRSRRNGPRVGRPPRGPQGAGRSRRPVVPRPGGPARAVLVALVIALAIASAAVADAVTRETRLTVLDVGQGDAILLESRTGARMLVDGGPDPQRLLVELDARVPPWDRRIDAVVLTHPHEDHVAGLVALLDRYAVRRVYENGMRGPGPGWAAWDARLAHGPPRAVLATGARIRLGEITLSVLWPDHGTVPVEPPDDGREINDRSIVLLGAAYGRRFLLTGDAEDDVDPQLVGRGLPRLDVLKVAHHGSATATSAAFLDATHPAVAVVSVGAGNPYGHPAPATLARLGSAGARVYRTDRDGSVEVDLRAEGVVVHPAGARRAATTTSHDAETALAAPGALGTPALAAVDALGSAGALAAGPATLRYDPLHDGLTAACRRPAADVARTARVVPSSRLRRGGRRGVAGRPGGRQRARGGRGPDGRGGAAARRGQAALGRGAGPPPPRRRLRRLARGTGLARGRADRARPRGDTARGAGLRGVGPRRDARDEDRGLRGQAGRPAAGAHGGAVRVVATAVPARLGRTREADRWHGLGRGDDGARGGARSGPGAGGLHGGRFTAGRGPPAALVAPGPA